jgi:citrate synthase
MGHVAGWLAHAREQALAGRLIRPAPGHVEPFAKDAAWCRLKVTQRLTRGAAM